MLKKISILLSSIMVIVLCFSGLTFAYNQAPELNEKVEEGELQPVELRLPKEPLEIDTFDSIGKYGGTITTQDANFKGGVHQGHQKELLIGKKTKDHNELIPNIAKDWETSEDGKSFTLYLREGIKWSDGEPFTVDDIIYQFKDVLYNDTLNPVTPGFWTWGGERFKLEKIDDYTIKFKFAEPYYGFKYLVAQRGYQGHMYNPKHYLKQFHVKYNSEADKIAEDEGFDNWHQLYQDKASMNWTNWTNLEMPALSPWVKVTMDPSHAVFERNPYYWKVDKEGNQLPYINKWRQVTVGSSELRHAKVLSGEVDVDFVYVDLAVYPAINRIKEEYNYDVWIGEETWISNATTVFFNHSIEDSFLNELFNNPKFKQAMSLAINRKEINDVVYQGIYEPSQATVSKSSPYYKEEYAEVYTEYNPERAKKLLKEIGLDKNEKGQWVRSDNDKPIEIVLDVPTAKAYHASTGELIVDYWNNIGMKTTLNITDDMWTHSSSNTLTAGMWRRGWSNYATSLFRRPFFANPYLAGYYYARWMDTDGEEGIEPTQAWKEWAGKWEKPSQLKTRKERFKAAREAMAVQAEHLFDIGIVDHERTVRVARESIKNIPRKPEIAIQNPKIKTLVPEQWYFEE